MGAQGGSEQLPVQSTQQLQEFARSLAADVQQHLGTSTPVPAPNGNPPASGEQQQR